MQEIIDLALSYLRGMWRYRWYALALAWVICLVGWAHVYRMPDQYRSSARISVDTASILRPLMRGLAVDTNPSSQIEMMTRTLLSHDNLQKIARMTDLDLRARDSDAMNDLLDSLKGKIRLGSDRRNPNLYDISANDRNPELARKLVQAVLTVFMESSLGKTRQDTDNAQRFLDQQIKEHEARLVAAEKRVEDFKRKYVGMMPGSQGGYYSRMETMTNELKAAQLDLQQAEHRRDSLRQQIENQSFNQQDIPLEDTYSITLPIDARIQALEQKLDDLLLRFTERHPDVITSRALLDELKQRRQEELAQVLASQAAAAANGQSSVYDANPVMQQMKIVLAQEEANVAALQTRVQEYEQRLQELQNLVNTVPEIESQWTALNRDYEITRGNYQTLLARREQARMSEDYGQSADDVRFQIIEPPRVPQTPSGPNRPALMSGVLFAGLGGGLGLAFLLVQLKPVFDNRRSLMEATGIPVFGSVGVVLSPGAIRRHRLGLAAYVSLASLLLMTYAGGLVLQAIGMPDFLTRFMVI